MTLTAKQREAVANGCPDCGSTLVRTPGAASRTHDGPRLDLVECSNPVCDFAEAVGDEMEEA